MTGTETVLLLAIAAILMVLVVLAIAETGLNRVSVVKARSLADSTDSKSARALVKLVEHPERFINPLLVTVTVLQTGQAYLAGILAQSLLPGWYGIAIAFVINVIVFFVLAESMPKTWAVLHTERAGLMTSRFTQVLVTFPPLRLISRGLIGLTNILIPGRGLKQGPFVSEQELLGIVGAAADDEVIEHDERELIESIIEFGDTVAREVMVPRPDMAIIPNEATVSEALDFAIDRGYSRLPVEGHDDEDVIGLAYTKDLMRAERAGDGARLAAELVRPIRFIPENKPVRQLMREMQTGKFHLAIVADEYGAVSGLVTLEDCLEELVGEIVDEYDNELPDVERLPTGEYLIVGGMAVSEVNELLDIDVPDDDWDTIGGFVFNTLGHPPEVGESIRHDGWELEVIEVEGRRIRRLRIALVPMHDEDDDASVLHAAASEEP